MKTLEDPVSIYAAYHQDGRNKATHFVGVPAIIVGILVPMLRRKSRRLGGGNGGTSVPLFRMG